jgi:hypothetical protein
LAAQGLGFSLEPRWSIRISIPRPLSLKRLREINEDNLHIDVTTSRKQSDLWISNQYGGVCFLVHSRLVGLTSRRDIPLSRTDPDLLSLMKDRVHEVIPRLICFFDCCELVYWFIHLLVDSVRTAFMRFSLTDLIYQLN